MGQVEAFRWRDLSARIEPLTLLHLDEVLAIERESHATPWTEKNFRDSIVGNHQCIALLLNDSISAYAIYSEVVGEIELLLFVVARPYWRCGLGYAFLKYVVENVFVDVESVFLEVRASNIAAQKLYEKVGFNQVGIRENYYRLASVKGNPNTFDLEDAILYAMEMIAKPT